MTNQTAVVHDITMTLSLTFSRTGEQIIRAMKRAADSQRLCEKRKYYNDGVSYMLGQVDPTGAESLILQVAEYNSQIENYIVPTKEYYEMRVVWSDAMVVDDTGEADLGFPITLASEEEAVQAVRAFRDKLAKALEE